MNEGHEPKSKIDEISGRGFFASLFRGLLRDTLKLIVAFAVGTGASAIVCWYYGLPLAISLIGGFIVLALALAFMSDGIFS